MAVGRYIAIALVGLLLAALTHHFSQPERNPMWEAAYRGDVRMLELLLVNGTDPNVRDEWLNTPLHWAAKGGQLKSSELLLKHGANASAQNRAGSSPLHWSATTDAKSSDELIRLLLKHGAKVNAVNNDGETALHWAVDWQKDGAVRELLAAKADPRIADSHRNLPLHKIDANCDRSETCKRLALDLYNAAPDSLEAPNEFGRLPFDHFDRTQIGLPQPPPRQPGTGQSSSSAGKVGLSSALNAQSQSGVRTSAELAAALNLNADAHDSRDKAGTKEA